MEPYFRSLMDKHRAFLLGCYRYYLKDCSYPLVIITYQQHFRKVNSDADRDKLEMLTLLCYVLQL